ncbi:DUF1592 domain-containing protein [Polyangium aurulentum]|uniref:DUF1592 domain-containing protein n=1 Tax=Polyangium aurulentum TaxID=2567896 RepID=UPI001982380E|nr:DUF1592 domain-containing protein [Polyangium aurulentum]UQA56873.1 DUF1592 domain-containing protein [Polyangium aurulentum]
MALVAVLTSAGCIGEIGGGTPGVECETTASPGAPVPMRRLTAAQVERTVSDVLGVAKDLQVSDERLFTFRSNVSSSVDFVGARGYLDFAEAAVAATDRASCTENGDACKAWLFKDVGQRLFRRPLTDAERARYEALFGAGAMEGDPKEGARWVLEAMLQSPTFLYMDEVVEENGYLDDWSIASRLALTIWGSNPDAELLAKAEAGALSTPEQITQEAERMLDDPRSLGGLTDFVDQWLRLERLNDPDARPDLEALGPETLAALRKEPVQLVQMLMKQGADVDELLTTSTTAPLPELASIYADDVVGETAESIELDPDKRAGILSLPGVMAALSHADSTSPTLRGYAVLSNFLCNAPLPPPAGVSVTLPDIGEGKSTRERLEAHFSNPTCAACHKSMDGMGFAFEGIDWLGRSRDLEFGKPIDDTSSFQLDGKEVTVDGPVQLASVMANSEAVANCLARQWVSYAGGMPDKKEAACLVGQIAEEMQQPEGLRKMVLTFVGSDWYRRGPVQAP